MHARSQQAPGRGRGGGGRPLGPSWSPHHLLTDARPGATGLQSWVWAPGGDAGLHWDAGLAGVGDRDGGTGSTQSPSPRVAAAEARVILGFETRGPDPQTRWPGLERAAWSR